MKPIKEYTIYWEVDGYSGNTQVLTSDAKYPKEKFDIEFAPHGYKLRSIEITNHNPAIN